MTEINLNWEGPIKFSEFEKKDSKELEKPENNYNLSNINSCGIYLHCLKLNGEYIVSYVGQAYDIFSRNREHYFDTKKRKCSLYDISKSHDGLKIDVKFIPNYDNDIEEIKLEGLIENNIKVYYLFYANVTDEIIYKFEDEISKQTLLGRIEGAIQMYLWRKQKSRKYLLTKVSNYLLRDTIIKNNFYNVEFEGLDGEIITPLSDKGKN